MKKSLTILIMALFSVSVNYAQITDAESTLKTEKEGLADGWNTGGLFSIGFNQVSLTNWAAGGQNSLSGNSLFNLFADYKKETLIWNTSLDLGYGLMKQGKDQVIKTDDKIDLLSKVGLKATEHWFYAGLLNFKTQMTPGYNYPNDSVIISKFLAPGYLLGALGMDYIPSENFSMFLAPVTGKITFVNDQALADMGSFGVDPGEKSRTEFGGYIRALYKRDITENIAFQTKADFFSNYLDNPEKIDVNWETLLLMKAGRFITVSLATHLIYDYDIKFDTTGDGEGDTDKVQFKQLLGVGLSYKF
jgi:hypothetical protein